MTTRLYYTEPARAEFTAVVSACASRADRIEVRLDQTAFYPASGGQPFDTGTIDEAAVVEVVDRDDGEIVHVVDRPLAVGARVTGRIDWARRFDHMQQHTGQHVLSAVYDRLSGAVTQSFHLGTEAATIDLGRVVAPDEVRAAEDEANRVVWSDRPVTIRFASEEEAARLPLRKEPARRGPLRLIDIEDCDLSACGGTHVARTGAIGLIATTAWEKFRGGTRVEFVCGGRALARWREWRDALAASTRHLSVALPELAAAIARLQADAKSSQRSVRALQEQLAAHEAHALVGRATRAGSRLIVVEVLDGWEAPGLKALASAVTTAAPAVAVALFTRASGLVVVARGPDGGIDAAAVLNALVASFGGRGGGTADLAQGGGLGGDLGARLTLARALLSADP